jgi:hypothetical protein
MRWPTSFERLIAERVSAETPEDQPSSPTSSITASRSLFDPAGAVFDD